MSLCCSTEFKLVKLYPVDSVQGEQLTSTTALVTPVRNGMFDAFRMALRGSVYGPRLANLKLSTPLANLDAPLNICPSIVCELTKSPA